MYVLFRVTFLAENIFLTNSLPIFRRGAIATFATEGNFSLSIIFHQYTPSCHTPATGFTTAFPVREHGDEEDEREGGQYVDGFDAGETPLTLTSTSSLRVGYCPV